MLYTKKLTDTNLVCKMELEQQIDENITKK